MILPISHPCGHTHRHFMNFRDTRLRTAEFYTWFGVMEKRIPCPPCRKRIPYSSHTRAYKNVSDVFVRVTPPDTKGLADIAYTVQTKTAKKRPKVGVCKGGFIPRSGEVPRSSTLPIDQDRSRKRRAR